MIWSTIATGTNMSTCFLFPFHETFLTRLQPDPRCRQQDAASGYSSHGNNWQGKQTYSCWQKSYFRVDLISYWANWIRWSDSGNVMKRSPSPCVSAAEPRLSRDAREREAQQGLSCGGEAPLTPHLHHPAAQEVLERRSWKKPWRTPYQLWKGKVTCLCTHTRGLTV